MLLAFAGMMLVAACAHEKRQPHMPDRQFRNDVLLPTTPVKNQGRSPLCWAYAMLATIETEHLVQGDSVNLSPDFVARHALSEMADQYYFAPSPAKPSLRGMATMLLSRLQRYGILAYDTYHAKPAYNYNVLLRKVARAVDGARSQQAGLAESRRRVERLLDAAIRPVPRFQFMFGAEYTTQEFAHSVCRAAEYAALTSFTHHPFGTEFVLEVPDNRDGDRFLNVPIDTLLSTAVRAISSGHPVCWEGDISEPGFSFARGYATILRQPSSTTQQPSSTTQQPSSSPHYPSSTTQQQRQQAFEHFQTTDDHCMAIVGLAHDQTGAPFFVCKNSWGTDNPYGGLMYMSFDYFLLKTIAIVVSAEVAFPSSAPLRPSPAPGRLLP